MRRLEAAGRFALSGAFFEDEPESHEAHLRTDVLLEREQTATVQIVAAWFTMMPWGSMGISTITDRRALALWEPAEMM